MGLGQFNSALCPFQFMSALALFLKVALFFLSSALKLMGLFLLGFFHALASAIIYIGLTIKSFLWSLSYVFTVGYPLYHSGVAYVIKVHLYLEAKEVIVHEIILFVYSPAIYSWLRDFYLRHAFAITCLHFFGCWGFALRAAFVTLSLGYLDNSNLYEVWNYASGGYLVRYTFFLISRKEIMEYHDDQRALEIRSGYKDPAVLRAEALVLSRSFL